MRNIFEDKSSHEIAVFIAKNMNKLLINENSYCVLCLFSDKTFLTIEKYYGEDGKNVRKGDYPGNGVMKFYGPQHPSVVDFIVNLVIDEEYDVVIEGNDFRDLVTIEDLIKEIRKQKA